MNKELINDYMYIVVGTMLIAIGITVFWEPSNLVTGGVTGLAIVIKDFSQRLYGYGIPLWLTNIVLNIPLFFLALRSKGAKFIAKTFFATIILSVFLSLASMLPKFSSHSDMIISSIFGAVLSGVGMGFIFRSQASTGGTDIAASLIHNYLRHISIAKILFAVDSFVILLGFFAFGARSAMYAIIAVYTASKFTDRVLEGFHFAKAAFIISDNHDRIAKAVMDATERGATALHATGVYTGNEKNVLLLVMSNKEIVLMKEVVRSIDPSAFVIVTDVREVLGEGFQKIS